MEFKLNKKNLSIILSKNKDRVDIELKEDYSMVATVFKADNSEIVVDKPGEYGFGFVQIIAVENAEEGFEGKVDLLNIIDDHNISVLVYEKQKDFTKFAIDAMYEPNIIASSGQTGDHLVKLARKQQPEVVVIAPKFADTSDENIQKIKSDLNVVDESKKLKFKESEFNSEEDKPTVAYILN